MISQYEKDIDNLNGNEVRSPSVKTNIAMENVFNEDHTDSTCVNPNPAPHQSQRIVSIDGNNTNVDFPEIIKITPKMDAQGRPQVTMTIYPESLLGRSWLDNSVENGEKAQVTIVRHLETNDQDRMSCKPPDLRNFLVK